MLPLAWPATPSVMPPSSGDEVAQVVHELLGRLARRAVGRHHLEGEEVAVVGDADRRDRDDVVCAMSVSARSACVATTSSSVDRLGQLGHDEQRAVLPAPNSSATAVYARYWVESSASDEPSGRPRRIDSAGMAMTSEDDDRERPRATMARAGRIGCGSGRRAPRVADLAARRGATARAGR